MVSAERLPYHPRHHLHRLIVVRGLHPLSRAGGHHRYYSQRLSTQIPISTIQASSSFPTHHALIAHPCLRPTRNAQPLRTHQQVHRARRAGHRSTSLMIKKTYHLRSLTPCRPLRINHLTFHSLRAHQRNIPAIPTGPSPVAGPVLEADWAKLSLSGRKRKTRSRRRS